jgi:fumarylacetoacetate (FAA) hydrolase
MRFGERVRMQALFEDGSAGPFGSIDQQVVPMAHGRGG